MRDYEVNCLRKYKSLCLCFVLPTLLFRSELQSFGVFAKLLVDSVSRVRGNVLDGLDGLAQVVVVHEGGATDAGVEEGHQEAELDHVVEGNEVEDEASKVVENVEAAEDDPVGEPLLLLLIVVLAVQADEGLESGVRNSDQAGDVAATNAEHDAHDAEDH